MTRKLGLDDIADTRAYERERAAFRAHVIDLKRRRRVTVGPFITLVFENRDTIRFQIQEMARAERISDDAGVQVELDAYNPLIPEPGQLCATMFLELTSDADMRAWLPMLVGIERSVAFRLGQGSDAITVRAITDEQHAARLTREHTTSAVHYVRFELSPAEIEAFDAGPVELILDHENYQHATPLGPETTAELLADLRA